MTNDVLALTDRVDDLTVQVLQLAIRRDVDDYWSNRRRMERMEEAEQKTPAQNKAYLEAGQFPKRVLRRNEIRRHLYLQEVTFDDGEAGGAMIFVTMMGIVGVAIAAIVVYRDWE